MDMITQNQKDIIIKSKKVPKSYRRKVLSHTKHKAREAIEDLIFLAEYLPERTRQAIFSEEAVTKLLNAILAFDPHIQRVCRLPLSLNRKRPINPKWIKSGTKWKMQGRWRKIGGGVLRGDSRNSFDKKADYVRLRNTHTILTSIFKFLVKLSPIKKNQQVVWLNQTQKNMKVRTSRYKIIERQINRYDLQSGAVQRQIDKYVTFPIGKADPMNLSILIIETCKDNAHRP